MSAPLQYPATCLSEKPHDHRVSDIALHYSGCLPARKRRRFFEELPPELQRRVLRDQERIDARRSRLERQWQDTAAGTRLRDFKAAMAQWSLAHGRRSPYEGPGSGLGSRRPSTLNGYFALDGGDVDAEIKAPVMCFKGGRPMDLPGLEGSFPSQKIPVRDLLADDPVRNPLMEAWRGGKRSTKHAEANGDEDADDDTVRYFHLPANNMVWVEEAIARYYHEQRPDPDDLFMVSRTRHTTNDRGGAKTRTELLLRPECWTGQRNFDDSAEVHARHMRPFCDAVAVEPPDSDGAAETADGDAAWQPHPSKNLVLFMPYLHWETDRGRLMTAAAIKEAGKHAGLFPLSEVVKEAQYQHDHEQGFEGHHGRYSQGHDRGHDERVQGLSRKPTNQSATHHGLAEVQTGPGVPNDHDGSAAAPSQRRFLLGQLLFRAAALLEAMEFEVEGRLIAKYLHARPPLQPRRTLDQSYYGALKSTGTRDRDQVVYRGTTPSPHSEHSDDGGVGLGPCEQCREHARRVPRLLMVDQLWLWILDERAVISAFPRRFGGRIRPDRSAVHKSLRARLRAAGQGGGGEVVSSAYDLALIIVDECSRVFFDRTKAHSGGGGGLNGLQPNLVELFADAIRGVTYKQTAAFDQFLIYTHLASREYRREREASSDFGQGPSTSNTLLSINPEGNLLKEIKDIMDEIHIMTRIKSQQQVVMETFVRHVRRAMTPKVRAAAAASASSRPAAGMSSWDSVLFAATSTDASGRAAAEYPLREQQGQTQEKGPERRRRRGLIVQREAARAKWTLGRADHLLQDIQDRILELNTLMENARITSAALKDLLTLKQQQAGVIEAREAVKQAALTLKQGQSIMIFTMVTIIFLPLSFFATLFGMNSFELNDGKVNIHDELLYMLPISAGIIFISVLLAFSRSALSNSIVTLVRSSISFVLNTAVTWILVHSGLHALGRDAAAAAHRLRDREAKITGGMKAEVMRRRANLEKTRAAAAMRDMARNRGPGAVAAGGDDGGGRSTELLSPMGPPTPSVFGGGTIGALSPYSEGPSPGLSGRSATLLGSQWRNDTEGSMGSTAKSGKGLAIQMRELHDVELGHGGHRKTSSQLGLMSRPRR